MVNLYQVSVRNRVIYKYEKKNGKVKPMYRQQGRWYYETLLFTAKNKTDVERKVHEKIAPRIVLGIYKHKRDLFCREIQILDIEEIA